MASSDTCDVLIVEDDLFQSNEMGQFLARAGLSVKTAYDLDSAVIQAVSFSPCVALIDYNLPGTNGLTIATQLRTILPDVSMIMMSGDIDGVPETTLRTVGVKVFVNKPIPLRPLRDAVLKLVRLAPPCNRAMPHTVGPVMGSSETPSGDGPGICARHC